MKLVTADSGPVALELVRQAAATGTPFELIILAAMMPEMDGFALAAQLKQEPHSLAEVRRANRTLSGKVERLEQPAQSQAEGGHSSGFKGYDDLTRL